MLDGQDGESDAGNVWSDVWLACGTMHPKLERVKFHPFRVKTALWNSAGLRMKTMVDFICQSLMQTCCDSHANIWSEYKVKYDTRPMQGSRPMDVRELYGRCQLNTSTLDIADS